MDWLKMHALQLLLPLLIAPLAMYATQGTKRLAAWVDRSPAVVKQGWAALYSAGFTALAAMVEKPICTGGAITCDLVGLDWRVVLTFAATLALHGQRRKP